MGDRGLGLYELINDCNIIIADKKTLEESWKRFLEYEQKPVEHTYYVSKELYDLIDAAIISLHKQQKNE